MTSIPPAVAPRIPVTTSYHGVEVTEDYRWLEEATAERTAQWTAEQSRRGREFLDALPCRAAVHTRVRQLLETGSTAYRWLGRGGTVYFAMKRQPPRQQPFLVALSDLVDTGTERVVVDPNAIDPSGETAIDFCVPSPDGAQVALSLSEHGSEDGTIFVYNVASGEVVDTPIAHANPAAAVASLAWRHDARAFWYCRSDPDGFHQQVWIHELGSTEDRTELSGVFADPAIVENFLTASWDGAWVMDQAQKGDGGEWQIFVRRQAAVDDPKAPDGVAAWWQVAGIADKCIAAAFGAGSLFLLSRAASPRGAVLRVTLAPDATVADAEEVVPPDSMTITGLAVTGDTLWVSDIDGGPCGLRAFGLDGTPRPVVEVPPLSTVSDLAALAADEAVWAVESFTEPAAWWIGTDGAPPQRTGLGTTTAVDLSSYEVTREFATSKDGTAVPLSVIAAPETPRDGSAPALLTGYGGYGISLSPHFDPQILVWLEQGGVYAVANIRGGGEYGEQWHHQGRLAAKQNCFDDFIACADHLVQRGITRRDLLAIRGGSNGGLLMGAVVTQRPDIARAVVAAVPVMDMLRVETTPNGRYNVTEFGSVEDPDMFAALLAYSPYHNVSDGTRYPAVLLTGGEFDPRVDAWHPKKMYARLQAATASDEPILLRMESGGHGLGQSLDREIDLVTDYYAFLFDRLGITYRPPQN
ncbi:MAG: S9 family peptidase [Acidimicrobiaceae bacterium]|nr:S9 family peptidase [Acidimicrobiaceae bacterium]